MIECKYNYQEKVEFKWNDGTKGGYIEIIDRFGTFGQPDEPSYDIMSYESPPQDVTNVVDDTAKRIANK